MKIGAHDGRGPWISSACRDPFSRAPFRGDVEHCGDEAEGEDRRRDPGREEAGRHVPSCFLAIHGRDFY